MDLGLNGSRALVTGASMGLGLAVARTLLQEGVQVVLNSRKQANLDLAGESLIKEGLRPAGLIAGDLSQKDVPGQVIARNCFRTWRT